MSRDNGNLIVQCFFVNLIKLRCLEYIAGLHVPAIDTLVNIILDFKEKFHQGSSLTLFDTKHQNSDLCMSCSYTSCIYNPFELLG